MHLSLLPPLGGIVIGRLRIDKALGIFFRKCDNNNKKKNNNVRSAWGPFLDPKIA